MHAQDTHLADPVERAVLFLVLSRERPWTGDALVREIGTRPATADALFELCAAGLIDETDGLVLPTRAAVRSHELMYQ